jgi:hypothetical protein
VEAEVWVISDDFFVSKVHWKSCVQSIHCPENETIEKCNDINRHLCIYILCIFSNSPFLKLTPTDIFKFEVPSLMVGTLDSLIVSILNEEIRIMYSLYIPVYVHLTNFNTNAFESFLVHNIDFE